MKKKTTKKDSVPIHPRDYFAERMSLSVPHIENDAVRYALAAAARHFGMYAKTTAISDCANYMFGRYVTKADAEASIPNPSVLPPAAPAGREQRVVGSPNQKEE